MFFEISNLKIETNLDKNLENKLESLFCDSCNRPHSYGPGCCVGCYIKANFEIKQVPNLYESKCQYLGNDGHCFYCKKENTKPGEVLPSELCKNCDEVG